MNKISLWLSGVALALVIILYYLHFSHVDFARLRFNSRPSNTNSGTQSRIAYFEMDSVENNYEYVKEIREALRKKEENVNYELNALRNSYQKKILEWQKKGSNLSQAESDAMNHEYQQMQVNYDAKQKELNDGLENEKYRKRLDINKKISDFLKDYNKDKGYTYIIMDEQSLIYYKDTVYNITNDLVAGLNKLYKTKKGKD